MEHATACSSGRLGASAPLRPCRPSAQQLFLAGRRHARQERPQTAVQSAMGIGFHQQSSGLVLPSQQLEAGPDYGLSVKQMQVLGLTNDGSFATARLPEVKAVSASAARLLLPACSVLLAACGTCVCQQAAKSPAHNGPAWESVSVPAVELFLHHMRCRQTGRPLWRSPSAASVQQKLQQRPLCCSCWPASAVTPDAASLPSFAHMPVPPWLPPCRSCGPPPGLGLSPSFRTSPLHQPTATTLRSCLQEALRAYC